METDETARPSLRALGGVTALCGALSVCRPALDGALIFAHFWPRYLAQQPATRMLHALGTAHLLLFPWICYGKEAALRTVLSLLLVLSAALPLADLVLSLSGSPLVAVVLELVAVALALTVACRVCVGAPGRFVVLLCFSYLGPSALAHLLIERNTPVILTDGPSHALLGDLSLLAWAVTFGRLDFS